MKFTSSNTESLIDALINAGGGSSPYAKFTQILKNLLPVDAPISVIRRTLMLWLDTMGVFDVDFLDFTYQLRKPVWVPSALEGWDILLGALSKVETEDLVSKGFSCFSNTVSYTAQFGEINIVVGLPRTFYRDNSAQFVETNFPKIDYQPFSKIKDFYGWEEILSQLEAGGKSGKIEISQNGNMASFFENATTYNKEFISESSLVKKFNWRTRSFMECQIMEELFDDQGVKLIRYYKDFNNGFQKKFVLLLEKLVSDTNWSYWYFDSTVVDERWARFIYISKLQFYEPHYDLSIAQQSDSLYNDYQYNVSKYRDDYGRLIRNPELGDISQTDHHFIIQNDYKKQFFLYDARKGIFGFPCNMLLPKSMMQALFACSGKLPITYTNNFAMNPSFPIKLLFSGKLSENGRDISYPEEKYFMQEKLFLFPSIPKILVDTISKKLNIGYYNHTFFINDIKYKTNERPYRNLRKT